MAEVIGAFMTILQAARELGVSPRTAYRLVASRQIPVVRLRGRIRVPRAALREWVEARAREALASVHETGSAPSSRPPDPAHGGGAGR